MSSSVASSNEESGRRIHILGIGNIGKLFAHALAIKPSPAPVTLLLHRPGLVDDWHQAGGTIDIITNSVSNRAGHYDVETISQADSSKIPITNLIIATKAAKTVAAIESVRDRLTKQSTILFAQNGMGTVDEVTLKVFPDPDTRPKFLNSVVSHGIYTTGTFSSVHAGLGYIAVGSVPSPGSQDTTETSCPLIEEVVSASLLNPRHVSSAELLCLQLEKITVNAMMNPLTVIFDCQNGQLFTRKPILALMRTLLAEVSDTIRALPELKGTAGVQERFSKASLEQVVIDMAAKTGKNTSSMLQDRRAGRETEVDYINGYLCRRAGELGLPAIQNQKVVDMIKEEIVITPEQIGDYFDVIEVL